MSRCGFKVVLALVFGGASYPGGPVQPVSPEWHTTTTLLTAERPPTFLLGRGGVPRGLCRGVPFQRTDLILAERPRGLEPLLPFVLAPQIISLRFPRDETNQLLKQIAGDTSPTTCEASSPADGGV